MDNKYKIYAQNRINALKNDLFIESNPTIIKMLISDLKRWETLLKDCK